jgi:hypothetical protein
MKAHQDYLTFHGFRALVLNEKVRGEMYEFCMEETSKRSKNRGGALAKLRGETTRLRGRGTRPLRAIRASGGMSTSDDGCMDGTESTRVPWHAWCLCPTHHDS